jgi:hypothetical protein
MESNSFADYVSNFIWTAPIEELLMFAAQREQKIRDLDWIVTDNDDGITLSDN